MSVTTIILLPEAMSPNRAVHWWTADNGKVTGAGTGEEWLGQVTGGAGGSLIALAPAAAVRLLFAPAQSPADRQALGIARSTAVVGGLADPATLHAVSAFAADGGDGRQTVTAVVANGLMLEWLDWLDGAGADPAAIVPAGLLVPRSPQWLAAAIGSDRLLVRDGIVIPDEPALRAQLVGPEEIASVAAELIEQRLAALPAAIPLNLRSGRFARRRILVLDRARLRELVLLAAMIPLLGLLMAVVTIVRLNSDSRSLERETAALVSDRIGRQVDVEGAQAALNARLTEQAGAAGSAFSPLAALYQQLQLAPAVGAQALAWRSDGTLSATLAAPRADDLNRVLIGLQATGYRITAVPRQGSDGRAMTDVTVRSAP